MKKKLYLHFDDFKFPLAIRIALAVWCVSMLLCTICVFFLNSEECLDEKTSLFDDILLWCSPLLFFFEVVQIVRLICHKSSAVKMVIWCEFASILFSLVSYDSSSGQSFLEWILPALIINSTVIFLLLSQGSQMWVNRMRRCEIRPLHKQRLAVYLKKIYINKLIWISVMNLIFAVLLALDITAEKFFIKGTEGLVGNHLDDIALSCFGGENHADVLVPVRRERWFGLFWRVLGMDSRVTVTMEVSKSEYKRLCAVMWEPSGITLRPDFNRKQK